jgi:hypothetical protein
MKQFFSIYLVNERYTIRHIRNSNWSYGYTTLCHYSGFTKIRNNLHPSCLPLCKNCLKILNKMSTIDILNILKNKYVTY